MIEQKILVPSNFIKGREKSSRGQLFTSEPKFALFLCWRDQSSSTRLVRPKVGNNVLSMEKRLLYQISKRQQQKQEETWDLLGRNTGLHGDIKPLHNRTLYISFAQWEYSRAPLAFTKNQPPRTKAKGATKAKTVTVNMNFFCSSSFGHKSFESRQQQRWHPSSSFVHNFDFFVVL